MGATRLSCPPSRSCPPKRKHIWAPLEMCCVAVILTRKAPPSAVRSVTYFGHLLLELHFWKGSQTQNRPHSWEHVESVLVAPACRGVVPYITFTPSSSRSVKGTCGQCIEMTLDSTRAYLKPRPTDSGLGYPWIPLAHKHDRSHLA